MTWNDVAGWSVAVVAVWFAIVVSVATIDGLVFDPWRKRSDPSTAPTRDEDDESDVLDAIHCRIDEVNERIDRLVSRTGKLETTRHDARLDVLGPSVAEHAKWIDELRARVDRCEFRGNSVWSSTAKSHERLDVIDKRLAEGCDLFASTSGDARSAITALRTSCRSLDRSLTSTANDVEDLRRRVEALEGQCQPLADGLSEEEA